MLQTLVYFHSFSTEKIITKFKTIPNENVVLYEILVTKQLKRKDQKIYENETPRKNWKKRQKQST